MEAIRFHGGMRANIPRFRPGQDSTIAHFLLSRCCCCLKNTTYTSSRGWCVCTPPTSTIQLYSEKQSERYAHSHSKDKLSGAHCPFVHALIRLKIRLKQTWICTCMLCKRYRVAFNRLLKNLQSAIKPIDPDFWRVNSHANCYTKIMNYRWSWHGIQSSVV